MTAKAKLAAVEHGVTAPRAMLTALREARPVLTALAVAKPHPEFERILRSVEYAIRRAEKAGL